LSSKHTLPKILNISICPSLHWDNNNNLDSVTKTDLIYSQDCMVSDSWYLHVITTVASYCSVNALYSSQGDQISIFPTPVTHPPPKKNPFFTSLLCHSKPDPSVSKHKLLSRSQAAHIPFLLWLRKRHWVSLKRAHGLPSPHVLKHFLYSEAPAEAPPCSQAYEQCPPKPIINT
jgi:hypothetical protein